MAHGTLKWLGLWALERFLPKQNSLEIHIRNILKGAMLMIMGGLILVSVFIGGLVGLHYALVSQGIHPGFATAIIGSIALLSAYICFVQADRVLKEVLPEKSESSNNPLPKLPTVSIDVALQEGVSLAIGSFLNGLRGKPNPPTTPEHNVVEVDISEEEAVVHFPREKGAKKR